MIYERDIGEDEKEDAEEGNFMAAGYSAEFCQLNTTIQKPLNLAPEITNVNLFILKKLVEINQDSNGEVSRLINTYFAHETKTNLKKLFTEENIPFAL